MKKIRLDQLLVQRGLAESRTKAQALIMSGVVRVAGQSRDKAGDMIAADAALEVVAPMPYASRGGYKLAHALDAFALDPTGLTALDVGASTGGFTDVLLQRGAAHVYAVDVGYGLLDWKLQSDPRVTVIDRTNIRYLDALPPRAAASPLAGGGEMADTRTDCAVIDTAFISLRLVLPATQRLLLPQGWIVALIKPQFEAGPELVGKGGVVRDPQVHAKVIRAVLDFAVSTGLVAHGLVRSPITGPAGNVEFLAWLGGEGPLLDVEAAITSVVIGGSALRSQPTLGNPTPDP